MDESEDAAEDRKGQDTCHDDNYERAPCQGDAWRTSVKWNHSGTDHKNDQCLGAYRFNEPRCLEQGSLGGKDEEQDEERKEIED